MFSSWNGRFEQITSGRFQGKLTVVQGNFIRANCTEGNQSILLRGHANQDRFTIYPVTQDQRNSLWQRRRLDAGTLVLSGSNTESDHCSARRVRSIGLSIPSKLLELAASLVRQVDAGQAPLGWSTQQLATQHLALLHESIQRFFVVGAQDCSEVRQFEQQFMISLIDIAFPQTILIRPESSLTSRFKLTRDAEDLMRANLHHPLGAIDICSALGASDRSLRLAFKERFGVGPMIYYKTLRLNAVRNDLKYSREPAIAIAHRWGFSHMGNFSVDYRRAFGESPSQTARYARAKTLISIG